MNQAREWPKPPCLVAVSQLEPPKSEAGYSVFTTSSASDRGEEPKEAGITWPPLAPKFFFFRLKIQKATKPMSPSMRTPAITPITAVPPEPTPPLGLLLPTLFAVCGASKGGLLFGKIGGDGTVVCGPWEGGDGDTWETEVGVAEVSEGGGSD